MPCRPRHLSVARLFFLFAREPTRGAGGAPRPGPSVADLNRASPAKTRQQPASNTSARERRQRQEIVQTPIYILCTVFMLCEITRGGARPEWTVRMIRPAARGQQHPQASLHHTSGSGAMTSVVPHESRPWSSCDSQSAVRRSGFRRCSIAAAHGRRWPERDGWSANPCVISRRTAPRPRVAMPYPMGRRALKPVP